MFNEFVKLKRVEKEQKNRSYKRMTKYFVQGTKERDSVREIRNMF